MILFQVKPNRNRATMSTEFVELSQTSIIPWKRKSDYAKYVKKVYPVTEQLKDLKSSIDLKERESKALLERMNTAIKKNRQTIAKLFDQNYLKRQELKHAPYQLEVLPAGKVYATIAHPKINYKTDKALESMLDKLFDNCKQLNLQHDQWKKCHDTLDILDDQLKYLGEVRRSQDLLKEELLKRLKQIHSRHSKMYIKWQTACNVLDTYKHLIDVMQSKLINLPNNIDFLKKSMEQARQELEQLSNVYSNELKRSRQVQDTLEETKTKFLLDRRSQASALKEVQMRTKKVDYKRWNQDRDDQKLSPEQTEARLQEVRKELDSSGSEIAELSGLAEYIKEQLCISQPEQMLQKIDAEDETQIRLIEATDWTLQKLVCKENEIRLAREQILVAENKCNRELNEIRRKVRETQNLYLVEKEKNRTMRKKCDKISGVIKAFKRGQNDVLELVEHIELDKPGTNNMEDLKNKVEIVIESLRPKPGKLSSSPVLPADHFEEELKKCLASINFYNQVEIDTLESSNANYHSYEDRKNISKKVMDDVKKGRRPSVIR